MKFKDKSVLRKKQLLTVCLASAFAAVLILTVVFVVIYSKNGETETKSDPPEIVDGESLMNGYAIAYPTMNEKDITFIKIDGPAGVYGMYRPDEGDSNFEIFYGENSTPYVPDIIMEDPYFSYYNLYAMDNTAQGFGTIPKLTFLCRALMIPYFEERIPISENEEERKKQLKAYGFEDDKITVIGFSYETAKLDANGNPVKDADGNAVVETKSHTLTIGRANIADTGYYFLVDNRNYVYASIGNYFDYALAGVESLIKPTLVSGENKADNDNGFGPYLTQGYYQYNTEQHKNDGEIVLDDSRVVIFSDVLTTPTGADTSSPSEDGLIHNGYKEIEVDLSKYKGSEAYKSLIDALAGKGVGAYGDTSGAGNIIFSVIHAASSNRLINFEESESVKYTYRIKEIVSVFAENGEIFDTGAAVGENTKVKLRYTVTAGEKTFETLSVLDITNENLPQEVKDTISAASVGELSEQLVFSMVYTKENTAARIGKYKVTEIVSIKDQNGKTQNKITADSIVEYRYAFEVDGVIWEEDIFGIDLSKVEDTTDKLLKEEFIGLTVDSKIDLTVNEYVSYYEFMNNFTTYKVANIKYFITSELVSAFKFQNASERDPYYGESIYENILPADHEFKLYGLNYNICQGVVRFLGGIDADGESVSANGLSGIETVAIGLTPAVMDEYGLYAHRIEFSLPRSIDAYTPEGGSEDESVDNISEYDYGDIFTFTLYISEINHEDGTRYVGSDLYDLVTKVNASDLFFIDEEFVSFWARRNIILVDVEDVSNISVEFGFEDMKGKYNFDISHKTATQDNGSTAKYTYIDVTPIGECTETALTKIIKENPYLRGHISMTHFFRQFYEDDPEFEKYTPESLGSTYFKEVLLLLYATEYEGVLSEEDIAKKEELNTRLMRIELKLNKGSAWTYVYEFYAVDANKVAVSIHQEDLNGEIVSEPACHFYISTFALKKVAKNGFIDLLNGIRIDPEIGYPDDQTEN